MNNMNLKKHAENKNEDVICKHCGVINKGNQTIV